MNRMIVVWRKLLLAGTMVLALCAAKATNGVDFKDGNLAQLEIGRSSLQDAISLLGTSPQASQVGVTGSLVYTWLYVEATASMWTGNSKVKRRSLQLVFNPDGTFQRIGDMEGVMLDPATMKRLFSDPAAEAAPKVQAALSGQAKTHPVGQPTAPQAHQYRCTDEKGQPYITVTADPPAGCVVQ